MRESGSGDLSDVAAVVLEMNGKFTVITQTKRGNGSGLADVLGTILTDPA